MKTKYLSGRVGVVFGLLAALCLLLLAALAALALAGGRWLWAAVAGAAGLAALLCLAWRWVYRPYRELARVMQLFSGGYLVQSIFEQPLLISPDFEQMMKRFEEMIDTQELFNSSKRQAQYLALQNQINPHFLYNTLEGIRGESLNAGLDSVADMTEALATFFRYTISNVENLVPLEDELGNVENYYTIQRYRFGPRLELAVEYDHADEARLMRCLLPKLTLQPIVENAIHHGIERKLGSGRIIIRLEATDKRLILTVSDNGLGMDREQVDKLNDQFNQAASSYGGTGRQSGGIAMVNVNSRIQLLFGEDYGLHIYSTRGAGTDVEITLPLGSDEDRYERGSITAG